jgi:hypothetical protein
VYCTVSPSHRPTSASGLLVLPQGKRGTLPLVSYNHSTVAEKGDAPSSLATDESRLVSFFFVSGGFAVGAAAAILNGVGLRAGN